MTGLPAPPGCQPASMRLRFFDDYGSGWLWSGCVRSRARFGYGPLDTDIARQTGLLRPETLAEAEALSTLHAASINQVYPPDGCPWPKAECDAFNARTAALFLAMQSDLAGQFDLADERLILQPAR